MYDVRWGGFAGGDGRLVPLCRCIDAKDASMEGGERGGGGTGGLVSTGGGSGFTVDSRC